MFSVKVKVDPEIQKKMQRLSTAMPRELGNALQEEGTAIMREAVQRAPRSDGTLAGSAYVTKPSANGAVEFGFGAPYAVIVHERTDMHHSRGESKFMQRALDAAQGGLLERIGQRLRPTLTGKKVSTSSTFPPNPPTGGVSRTKRSRVRAGLRGKK